MIVGDTHGNAGWLRRYIFPVAMTLQADAVVVLGDFGAWEHTKEGVVFMDRVNEIAQRAGIALYWLHGNHDKHSHTIKAYKPNQRGFLVCRSHVFYIPQGHTWTWGGVTFRSFGGAYSVDKAWRIHREQELYQRGLRQAGYRKQATGHTSIAPSTAGTLWFPEEEMTDAQMTELLAGDSERKDIVLSHDKPYSSKPDWNRKDITGRIPNQMRLERALRVHKPRFWLHGHLHYHYRYDIHGEDFRTAVIGLVPDDDAAEPGWKAADSWLMLDLERGLSGLSLGRAHHLDPEIMQSHISALN